MAPQLFWLAASIQFFLIAWFMLVARKVPPQRRTEQLFRLARGQRRDSWLSATLVWGAVASEGLAMRSPLLLIGALLLAWLCSRTVERLRVALDAA